MALSMWELLATKQITVLKHLAYLPDLASNYLFLFPNIKEILKGRHFDDIDDIRSNTTAALKAILQNQFQNCFKGWTRRWHRCISSQGEYLKATTVVFNNVVCSTFTAMSSRTLLQVHVLRYFVFCKMICLYTVSTIQRSVQMPNLLLKLRFDSYNRRQELNSSEELYCIMQSLPTSHL